jgi:hypothetical protein
VSTMRFSLLSAPLALLLASCSPLWDRANRTAFQDDLAEVLARSSTAVSLSDCHMEGTTRTGYCLLAGGSSQLEAIAASLNMGDPQPLGPGEGSFLPAFLLDSPCLAYYSSFPSNQILGYFTAGRPDQLRLADGGQFEYLLISFAPASGGACIQASYAYG